MKVQNGAFPSIEQLTDQYLKGAAKPAGSQPQQELSFQQILERKEQGDQVRFSRHAEGRLRERNITLSQNQLQRLQEGTERAEQKGIKESLVLVDSLAFIVNIKNNTVVTAMDQQDAAQNVFTNIDGAVIA